jgi:hypothetical protein
MAEDVCESAALEVEIPDLTAGDGDCDGDGSMGMGVGGEEECCRVVAMDGNLVSFETFSRSTVRNDGHPPAARAG